MELSSKAVELMAEERAFMQRCYARLRAELGDEELHLSLIHISRLHMLWVMPSMAS